MEGERDIHGRGHGTPIEANGTPTEIGDERKRTAHHGERVENGWRTEENGDTH